jgi:hypothetical protein
MAPATMRSTSLFRETSVRIAKARRPSARTSAATRSRFATVRLATTISAPAFANSSAMDRPMPVPPPVMIATLPGRARLGTLKGIGIVRLLIVSLRAPLRPEPQGVTAVGQDYHPGAEC